jgi:NAD(P)H-dependent FMN reductase
MPNILAFAGSTRRDSFNRRALEHAVAGARSAWLDVTVLDLADYPLPIYQGDEEAASGLPDNAIRLKDLFKSHQGLLIACPEYNSSITPLLKNTLDWISRPHGEESGLVPYQNKVAALVSASAGQLGGLRGLVHVRQILNTLGVLVLPRQLAVARADVALGETPDAERIDDLQGIGKALAIAVRRWNA